MQPRSGWCVCLVDTHVWPDVCAWTGTGQRSRTWALIAMWNAPSLNGNTSSAALRVPSGKIHTDLPRRRICGQASVERAGRRATL